MNIIPIEQKISHCPTICCTDDNNIYIAFYAGSRECENDQRVYVYKYLKNGKYELKLTLEEQTGNPVLFSVKSEVYLMYSLFTKKTERPVDKWRHCSNHIINIKKPEKIIIEIPAQNGYLGRINPIKIKQDIYIPIYKEYNCYGRILKCNSDLSKYSMLGKIGEQTENNGTRFGSGLLIQPSIWLEDNILHSVSRNIYPKMHYAWYSKSEDFGETWSDPTQIPLTSYNNSLCIISETTPKKAIWNYHNPKKYQKSKRTHLLLTEIDYKFRPNLQTIIQLNDHKPASYPNYIIDKNNKLHIVHSEGTNIEFPRMVIKHHEI